MGYTIKIKTASDLKYLYESNNPDGKYFTRDSMRFAGDTMRNYGIRPVVLRNTLDNETFNGFELYRRRPVRANNTKSAYFDIRGRQVHCVEIVAYGHKDEGVIEQ